MLRSDGATTMITHANSVQLVELLGQCEPGNLPSNIFEALAKVAVYPAVEFVLLRQKNGRVETMLFRRRPDDPVWPSMLHAPGTVLRPTDKSIESAISRLMQDELQGVNVSPPIFTGIHLNKYLRGNSLGVEYWLEVHDSNDDRNFYCVNDLPQNFIGEQKGLLTRAVNAYTEYKSK